MKKKSFKTLVALFCIGLLTGCGHQSKSQNNDNKQTIYIQQKEEKIEKEGDKDKNKVITGSIEDKKDFMFVIEDDKKNPFAFAFDDKLMHIS